jgi:hypothetical protein
MLYGIYVVFLRCMDPAEVRLRFEEFSPSYADDWQRWLDTLDANQLGSEPIAMEFERIMKRWNALRPRAILRCRAHSSCDGPYLDDIIARADELAYDLRAISVREIRGRTTAQTEILAELWHLFSRLPQKGQCGAVGITKAVMLLTSGWVGPALDSRVRASLGVDQPASPEAWVEVLEAVSEDIEAFESEYEVALEQLVPEHLGPVAVGRAYDMLGWAAASAIPPVGR